MLLSFMHLLYAYKEKETVLFFSISAVILLFIFLLVLFFIQRSNMVKINKLLAPHVPPSLNNLYKKILFLTVQENESKQSREQLFSDIPYPLILVRNFDEIIYSNKVFDTTFNFKPSEEKKLWKALGEDFSQSLVDLDSGYASYNYEEKIYDVFIGNQKESQVLFFIEVTEKKKLDEMKTNFVSQMTHELKTPLTSLLGYTQLLEETKNLELTPKIVNVTKKLDTLFNDLLDLSLIELGQDLDKKMMNLTPFVNETYENMNMKYPNKKIKFSSDLVCNKCNVSEKHFGMLLNIIFDNAIKYNDKDNCTIHTSMNCENGSISIKIADNGPGIKQEDLERIFTRLYRSGESSKEGRGLGLSIAKHIVKSHKGQITASNNKSEGVTFEISLPTT